MMPTLIRASQVTPTMTPRVNVDETDLFKTKILAEECRRIYDMEECRDTINLQSAQQQVDANVMNNGVNTVIPYGHS